MGRRDAVMDRDDAMARVAEIKSALEAQPNEFLIHLRIELAGDLAEIGDRRFFHAEKDSKPRAETLHDRLDAAALQNLIEPLVELVGTAIEPGIQAGLP